MKSVHCADLDHILTCKFCRLIHMKYVYWADLKEICELCKLISYMKYVNCAYLDQILNMSVVLGSDEALFFKRKVLVFFFYFSTKTYIVEYPNIFIFFFLGIRKVLCGYPFLSGARYYADLGHNYINCE